MTLPTLKIGRYCAQYPIIQGGMGVRISGAKLAAAVANAGGIGVISAIGLGMNSPYFDPDQANPKQRHQQFIEANRQALVDEVKKARALSPQGIIGVNVMMAAQDVEMLVKLAIANGANLILAGAGLPMKLPEYTMDYPEVGLIPIVSSTRAARLICQKWQRNYQRLPDAIVVENPNFAGGHLGAKDEDMGDPNLNPEVVLPDLLDYLQTLETPIPIIAAGGIWDRADIDRCLALGAQGVQMGTRFITTHECDADTRYKEYHLQATPEDVVLVPSPVGLSGRALRNPFAERILEGEILESRASCLANCLLSCKFRDRRETYCILRALDRASRGDVETGLIFTGSNTGRATELMPVAAVIQELVAGTNGH